MYMYVYVFQMSMYKSVGFMMGFGNQCVDLKKNQLMSRKKNVLY